MAGYAARVALIVTRAELQGTVDPEKLREAVAQPMRIRSLLGRMGGLLNQAVTALHSTGQPPAHLADAVARCSAAIERTEDATSPWSTRPAVDVANPDDANCEVRQERDSTI
ncbi:hypothetical protein [Plantactinospora soyae]|uniref:Uncharacterized protein n=1 Tax=Plantactinospora soyae TaxID=1544732 RepID=A0A927MBZ1_9ACTN|nr:hypothetical protein [Plantactinospora soyae]MBE1488275.1 hypothetical protein [Plantactinospora soyae]